ncbi:hypothetical protein [Halobaculum gomorrense]|uniref:Uncharacterized protein n=1 Tax=Halobaculum gomorrense TaxID=43928 RepID=A0A1M5PD24_9EURY|nr:hypothetical protein [Halobaculum gomorrense]SHG99638.1 hypothetical protein SAMN05443636_1552 [Halobaculum gomorrense]
MTPFGPAAVDPSIVADGPGIVRAVVSFVAVLLGGTAFVAWRPAIVDRGVDLAVEESLLVVGYGLVAFGLVAFIGVYAALLAARVRIGVIAWLAVAALLVAVLLVAALGYVVVGTWLTGVEGARRPWVGAVVGAVLGALPWLVLPPLPAAGVWLVLAAVGLGGLTRRWIHADREVTDRTVG